MFSALSNLANTNPDMPKSGSRNVYYAIVAVLIVIALLFVANQYISGEVEDLRTTPIVLRDEIIFLERGEVSSISTTFSKGQRLEVSIKVEEGGPVDIFLFNSGQQLDFRSFLDGKETTFASTAFGSSKDIKGKNYSFMIPSDDRWFIVVYNGGRVSGGADAIGDVSVSVKISYFATS